jgi:chromatin remodeling complex protein RSC6/RNA polymerase-binding transcription factor DksA
MEKNFLRKYRGVTFNDAGPYGDPGDRKLEISLEDGTVLHSLFFSETDPTSINKAIEKAKQWVNENHKEEALAEDQERYSDEDLAEFKEIIDKKLDAARKEMEYLQGLMLRKTGDEKPPEEAGEDSHFDFEQIKSMGERQEAFIVHLEAALSRIEDKTYGICTVTGKLIDRARLRAVPHATMSAEAKNMMTAGNEKLPVVKEKKKKASRKKATIEDVAVPPAAGEDIASIPFESDIETYRDFVLVDTVDHDEEHFIQIFFAPYEGKGSAIENFKYDPEISGDRENKIKAARGIIDELRRCRVCGCTKYNCKQCIEKTGSPCTWVEEDLCSACQERPAVKVIDERASSSEVVPEIIAAPVPIDFFHAISSRVSGDVEMTIRIMQKEGKMTVGLFPCDLKIPPVNKSGYPSNLDETFLTDIFDKVKDTPGFITRVKGEAVAAAAPPAVISKNKKHSSSASRKPQHKVTAKKKPVVKKPAPAKKPVAKKPAPKKKVAKPLPTQVKYNISPELQRVIGAGPYPKPEAIKKVWEYIRTNGLQDKKNKRMVNCDEKLKAVMGAKSQVSMFDMGRYYSKHLIDPKNNKPASPSKLSVKNPNPKPTPKKKTTAPTTKKPIAKTPEKKAPEKQTKAVEVPRVQEGSLFD